MFWNCRLLLSMSVTLALRARSFRGRSEKSATRPPNVRVGVLPFCHRDRLRSRWKIWRIGRAGCDWIVTWSSVFHTPDPEPPFPKGAHAQNARGAVRSSRTSYALSRPHAFLRVRPPSRRCGFIHVALFPPATSNENPIAKDTQHPQSFCSIRPINDISLGRYELARLT